MATVVVHRPRRWTVTKAASGGRMVARFGVAGPTGASGLSATRITTTVAPGFFSVSAGQTVRFNSNGTVSPGLPSSAAGIALNFAAPGGSITVQTAGVVEVAGWGLTPGATYYCDPAGFGSLTTTVPLASEAGRRVGVAQSATTMVLDFGPLVSADGGVELDADGGLTAPGGGGGDMLSVLTSAEIAVTTTATLTIGRMHVCSGTSADYTVTLPAAAGNAGKFVGVRMSTALTKLVTVDGNGSETIDGSTTRILWAGESAILMCDGTGWTKVAGLSIPFYCEVTLGTGDGNVATVTLSTGGWAKVPVVNVQSDAASLFQAASNVIRIPRTSRYDLAGSMRLRDSYGAGISYAIGIDPTAGGAGPRTLWTQSIASRNGVQYRRTTNAAAGTDWMLYTYLSSGGGGVSDALLSLLEVPTW